MRYFGGKARIGKELAEFINQLHPDLGLYVEPFGGGCSVAEHIKAKKRVVADRHPDLILMWQALQGGWLPPTSVSEDEYKLAKDAESSALRGFIGFGCSNSGKWFGGYARDSTGRNYAQNAHNGVLKKIGNMQDVEFRNLDYRDVPAESAVVYCDPPYSGTTGFSVGKFNTVAFWEWVRLMSKTNTVYISEYSAPDDFETVWEKSVKTDMKDSHKEKIPRVEKLFKIRG